MYNINGALNMAGFDRGFDTVATTGLLGTADSLAYRIAEIERHNHSWERWMCKATTPSGTHFADRIGINAGAIVPFELTAGNDTWGAWLQILGSGDTPVIPTMTKFDIHKWTTTTTDSITPWYIQIGFGTSGAQAVTDNTFCSFVFVPASSSDRTTPITLQTRRIAAGTLAWARGWSVGANGKKASFMFGLHEYEG
jgi:hypothetical protein